MNASGESDIGSGVFLGDLRFSEDRPRGHIADRAGAMLGIQQRRTNNPAKSVKHFKHRLRGLRRQAGMLLSHRAT